MPKHIHFYQSDIHYQPASKKKIRVWLNELALFHKHKIESINYIFCSDSFLLKMNQEFLNHDTLTDIITFDLGEKKGNINGEVYISIPRVKENSKIFKRPFEEERNRVIAHGLLHLIGFKDKNKSQSTKMRDAENHALELFASLK